MPAQPLTARTASHRALILICTLALVLPAPLTRAADANHTSQARAALEDESNRASALASSMRAAMTRGSIQDLISMAFGSNTPSTTARTTPITLADAIGGLADAVRQAEGLIQPMATGDWMQAAQAKVAAHTQRLPRAQRTITAPGSVLPLLPSAAALTTRPVAAPVDVSRLERAHREAAGLLAVALDEALPSLGSTSTSSTGITAAGCDLVDQTPVLCVGSAADNVYTKDASLLVDLGGNDVYENTAGGAPFTSDGQPVFVSVNVDVEGNDRYVAQRVPGDLVGGPLVTGQGAGTSGGIGVAVDMSGDDTYEAEGIPTGDGAASSFLTAQGAGNLGTGILLDLGGKDSYSTDGPDGVTPPTQSHVSISAAQGAGYVGVGLLVDAGTGSDTYDADAGTLEHTKPSSSTVGAYPYRMLVAQGGAAIGTGVLADGGGAGALTMTGTVTRTGMNRFPEDLSAGSAKLYGQGFASIGTGLLVQGGGDTVYSIDVHGIGTVMADARAQGYGEFGGLGLIDDLGGDDHYSVTADFVLDRELMTGDLCKSGIQEKCNLTVNGDRVLPSLQVHTQATGVVSGTGVVLDHEGNDAYDASVSQSVTATLQENRTAGKPAVLDVVGYGSPALYAQGTGLTGGNGILADAAGTDAYQATIANPVDASATSTAGQAVPETQATSSGMMFTAAQGAGDDNGAAGLLVDAAGNGDVLRTEVTNVASSSSGPDTAFRLGWHWPYFQGAGQGGYLEVLGSNPRVFSTPSRPACAGSDPGSRGFASWNDCVYGHSEDPAREQYENYNESSPFVSAGQVPNAVGAQPGLAFNDATASTAKADLNEEATSRARFPVEAVLNMPDGTPLANEPVHLVLQFECDAICQGDVLAEDPDGSGKTWVNQYQETAVTDATGLARARLPLRAIGLLMNLVPTVRFRLVAVYDGSPGLRPRHVGRPIEITNG